VKRELRKLRSKAGDGYAANLFVEVQPAGVDLFGHPPDAQWLEERCELRKPDVLIIGPAYKMAGGDPNTEPVARAIQQPLDRLRSTYGFSLLMELHTGHGANGGKRPTRPVGSSAWLRWPEFGMHLSDTGALTTWRGPRDEREWPRALKRGGAWLWTSETDPREVLWKRIYGWVMDNGRTASNRHLAEKLDVDRNQIQRAIALHKADWEQLRVSLRDVPDE